MEYNKIVSVTGLPGLFELVASKGDGAIVRSLDDNKAKFISGRVHNFSHLESIEIYTTRDNVNLVDVFKAMESDGGSLPDNKDNSAVKKYFEKVFPEMDFERVYASDMKKMVKWFEILQQHKIEIKLAEPPDDTTPAHAEEAPVKEKAAKKETKTKEAEDTEKPKKPAAKKTAAKKEEKEEAPKKGAKKK